MAKAVIDTSLARVRARAVTAKYSALSRRGRVGGLLRLVWTAKHVGLAAALAIGISVQPRIMRDLGGVTAVPVSTEELETFTEYSAPIYERFDLRVRDVARYTFVEGTGRAGPISDKMGKIFAIRLAELGMSAIAIAVKGPEQGTALTYRREKEALDGTGADMVSRAARYGGLEMLKDGYYFVTVSTEGTAEHNKNKEPMTGNPTVPMFTLFPSARVLKAAGYKIRLEANGLPVVSKEGKDLKPIFIGYDVVECTERASKKQSVFEKLAGHPVDVGALTVGFAADKWVVSVDRYADKMIVSRRVMDRARELGVEINLDASGDMATQIDQLARDLQWSVRDLGVAGLGLKPRYEVDEQGRPIPDSLKNHREGRKEMLEDVRQLGVKMLTHDDGETIALAAMAKGAEVAFEDGRTGPIDIYIGPGGVFETQTFARFMQDAGGKGSWCYVYKKHTKNPATYARRAELPGSEVEALAAAGDAYPSRSRGVEENIPDEGDRVLVMTPITTDPVFNRQAIPVAFDEKARTVTLYQEVITSDREVAGFLVTLEAKKGIPALREKAQPLFSNVMAKDTNAEVMAGLRELDGRGARGLDAIYYGLAQYLNYFVKENLEEGNDLILDADRVAGRADSTVATAVDIRALLVLQWAVDNHRDWFVNPEAIEVIEIPAQPARDVA